MKRLPPIYKDVKVPVYVEQPVIIRKIPVIHKKKEVTIKKETPIVQYDKEPTIIKKGVGYGEPKKDMMDLDETKAMIPKGLAPQLDYDMKRIPDLMKGKGMMDDKMDDKMYMEEGMGQMEVMKKMRDMMKPVDEQEDKVTDFDTDDFDVSRLTRSMM